MKLLDTDLSNEKDFLNAYQTWSQDENYINKTKTHCNHDLHPFWLCCREHRMLQANSELLRTWAHYFDVKYEMCRNYGQSLSVAWFREFRKRANV